MTQVEFKNHWFDGAKLWEPGRQEVPEKLLPILPTSAVILDKDGEPVSDTKQEEAVSETKAAKPDAAKDLKI